MDDFVIREDMLEDVSGGAYTGPCFRYTIAKGDTLSLIAKRFNTTICELAAINSIKNVDLIYAGKELLVPFRR